MVGLSVVLEGHHHHHSSSGGHSSKRNQVIISKTSSMSSKLSSKSSSSSTAASTARFPPPAFLERCFLCKIKLLPGKDIYMYKGDRAFCSVECRCRQIFMDEEETALNCSMAAAAPPPSPSSPAEPRHRRGGARGHRAAGGFAY